MRIIRDNFYDVVKLYINQIGITIFSMFLYTAVGAVEDDKLFNTLRVIVSVFSIIFYIILIYNVMWEIGAKDSIRSLSGHNEVVPLKGGILGLAANVPNLVLALVTVIFGIIYFSAGAEWAMNAFVGFFVVVRFHAAMYMGVIQGVTPAAPGVGADAAIITDAFVESIWFFVLPLVAVIVTQLAYWLGTKEKRIFGFLSNKGGENKNH